jgi:hypothetical protein
MPAITEVSTRHDLNRFIRLPHELHAGDPTFVPPLLVAERERLTATKNPFYRHARVSLFLAREGHRVVGRIAAIDDDNHNRTHRDNGGGPGARSGTRSRPRSGQSDAQ